MTYRFFYDTFLHHTLLRNNSIVARLGFEATTIRPLDHGSHQWIEMVEVIKIRSPAKGIDDKTPIWLSVMPRSHLAAVTIMPSPKMSVPMATITMKQARRRPLLYLP